MKKYNIAIFVSFFLIFTGSESFAKTFYKQQSIKEKTAHSALSFMVSFDNFGTKAEKAAGNPVSSLPQLNMGLRGVVGFDNQQGFEAIGDEELFYNAEKNISPEAGTFTLWVNADNYQPADPLTNGKNRRNIALFEAVFKQGKEELLFRLYEFKENVYFDLWWNAKSSPTQPLIASRKKIWQKQWHQIAVTWTTQRYEIYLNGEQIHSMPFGTDIGDRMKGKWDLSKSHFGIPLKVWGERRNYRVLFDDLKIYNRALSKTEIMRMYAEVDTSNGKKDINLVEMTLHGVDRTTDSVDLEIDMFSLPDLYAAKLKNNGLTLQYTLTGPQGIKKTQKIKVTKNKETVRLKGLDKPGKYNVVVSIIDGKKLVHAGKASIVRPDLSFMGNKIGITDQVPDPFTPLTMKNRTIKIWNREYVFGNGPFPVNVQIKGEEVLKQPPRLLIELTKGQPEILQFKAITAKYNQREAVLTGKASFGPAGKYSIQYKTTVAYDGMIRTDWTISGKPVIHNMRLEYQQNTAFTEYLMTPQYQKKAPMTFPYSKSTWNIPHIIWLATENKGGLAYATEHDANWIYNDKENIYFADRNTGKVAVTMISKTVRMPENTPYHALFTVTPTRPRYHKSHLLRLGQPLANWNIKRKSLTSESLYPGLAYNFDENWYKDKFDDVEPDNGHLVYGMADSISTLDKVGCYFARDYAIPGAFAYTFNEPEYDPVTQTIKKTKSNSLPGCSATSAPDYLLYNQYKLLNGKYGHKFWGIYYDLSENNPCSNPQHGCGFKDKFNREIVTRPLLNKRKLFERTLVIVREKQKILFLHAQKEFNPFMHSFGDYWYPGEENNGLTQNNLNCYCDDIKDANWKSEYNTHLLGVNVVFLGASAAWRQNVAEQLIGQCLLHNIEFCTAWMPGAVLNKVWSLCERYETDKALFSRYDKQKEVISSDPDLKISYYKRGNKTLFILMNRRPYEVNADVNFSKLGIINANAKDVYREKDYKIMNGKLTLDVAPRTFIMLAVPPLQFYPYKDNGFLKAGNWKPKQSGLQFKITLAENTREFTLTAAPGKDNTGCFTLNPQAKPGRTYTFKFKAKGENLNPEAKLHFLVVAQAAKKNIAQIPGIAVKEIPGNDWKEYIISGKVPTGPIWNETVRMQVTLMAEAMKQGKIFFKDLEIEEK